MATLALYGFSRYGEAEARAAIAAANKGLKQGTRDLRGNAWTCIRHFDNDFSRISLRPQRDLTATARVLNRICDQVLKGPPRQTGIKPRFFHSARYTKRKALCLCKVLVGLKRLREKVHHGHNRWGCTILAGRRQDLSHQTIEAVDLFDDGVQRLCVL